jgi:hypothetical protein
MGGVALFSAAGDAAHHRPGGLTGIVVGLGLATAGVGAIIWVFRGHKRVAADELQELRARGLDDGLPMGAFRQDQRVGLEASDTWLVVGVLMSVIGLVFAVAGGADPRVGWRFALAFSMVGFLPAALFFRLGTGTRYWLTPEGVARRGKLQASVHYADVQRIVPLYRNSPMATPEGADAFELQVAQARNRRWGGTDFTIRLVLVEIGGADLLSLLDERVRSARGNE